jgi:hypothetical protein
VPLDAEQNPDQNYCRSHGWDDSSDGCPAVSLADVCEYCFIPNTDLTGTVVTSSAPVAVVSGHQCSFVPFDNWACDHLEEMMFPTATWGTLSVMTAPIHPDGPASTAPTQYRVLALNSGTAVTFDPPVTSGRTLGAGEYMQFETDGDFVVEGSDDIYVTQWLLGQDELGSALAGDPAMGSGVPWSQVRDEYEFLTPSTYQSNYVNVVRPAGDEVELDGVPITQWEAIGSTGFEVARIPVNGGSHSIVARNDVGFGITAYGYASYTSYLFPGGMNFGR